MSALETGDKGEQPRQRRDLSSVGKLEFLKQEKNRRLEARRIGEMKRRGYSPVSGRRSRAAWNRLLDPPGTRRSPHSAAGSTPAYRFRVLREAWESAVRRFCDRRRPKPLA